MSDQTVTMPLDAAQALYAVYRTWWHQVGLTDPGQELVSDGVRLTDVVGLLDFADDVAMDEACSLVEPHEPLLRRLLLIDPAEKGEP